MLLYSPVRVGPGQNPKDRFSHIMANVIATCVQYSSFVSCITAYLLDFQHFCKYEDFLLVSLTITILNISYFFCEIIYFFVCVAI